MSGYFTYNIHIGRILLTIILFSVGHTATHAVVMARLITKGKDHGVHPFIVQLRSLNDHTPLPGKHFHCLSVNQ